MSNSGDVLLPAHILLFPFPTSGHILPLLDLAQILLNRNFTITVLITPSNLPLLQNLQSFQPFDSLLHTLVLPFPELSASSSHRLPAEIRSSSQLHDQILEWFHRHPSPPVALISDFFLGWTQNLATHLGIPRIVFWPSGALSSLILIHTWRNIGKIVGAAAADDINSVISFPNIPNSPEFPSWQVAEFPRQFVKGDPDWEFLREGLLLNSASWGAVFNSFSELEGAFIDDVKKEMGHDRVWVVGPLLPNNNNESSFLDSLCNRGGSSVLPRHHMMTWLDDKAAESVLYVCFGSRSILTSQQVGILADTLECSGVHFIWRADDKIPKGYKDRVGNRGLILNGWAPQVSILRHRAVGAFLTHCGWNSLMEGISSGVLMLTWPLDADQFINARLIVDELGLAIRACEGGPQTIPDPTELAQIIAQSFNHPKKVLVKKFSNAASEAVSSNDMNAFVNQLHEIKSK